LQLAQAHPIIPKPTSITARDSTWSLAGATAISLEGQTAELLAETENDAAGPCGGPWYLPALTMRETPGLGWQQVLLNVARPFFGVDDAKRFIDLVADCKMNVQHLHLADNQGWRIAIDDWPEGN
jgi:hexosaminidase